jgi:hypothetical protein
MSRRRPPSPQQRRQRELAWLLRILEGSRANILHALHHNARTLRNSEFKPLNDLVREHEAVASDLRILLKEIQ